MWASSDPTSGDDLVIQVEAGLSIGAMPDTLNSIRVVHTNSDREFTNCIEILKSSVDLIYWHTVL